MKLDRQSNDCVVSASEWRLLALMLRHPAPEVGAEITRLAAEVAPSDLRAAAAAAVKGSASAYLAVLGPGSSISPRLIAYRGMEDPGWILADVVRYYDAFAFRPAAGDPPDHVAVAADFVAYLHLKEAFARARSDHEAADVTAAARARFEREHLAPVAAPLAASLAAAGFEDLATTARLLADRLPAPLAPRAADARATDGPRAACDLCVPK